MMRKSAETYAFIDASNIFYGGEKSLGWKIDYQKLLGYLKDKYGVTKTFYYAGIDIGQYQPTEKLDFDGLAKHFAKELENPGITEDETSQIDRYIQRANFYKSLEELGFELIIKPVKLYGEGDAQVKKANCDVDLTFDLMRYMSQYKKVVIMSGDGDFAPVLLYLKKKHKEVHVLARGNRTAKEIRQLAGENFKDFTYLRKYLGASKA